MIYSLLKKQSTFPTSPLLFAGGRQQAWRCYWVSSSISEATAVFKSSSGTEATEDCKGRFLDEYTDRSNAL